VTLLPRAGTAGVRSIRVPDPDAAGTYYLEYRRSQGRDSGSALDGPAWCCSSYDPGVSMVYQPTGTNVSWMHPAGPGAEFALGLDDGTYTSPSGGLVLDIASLDVFKALRLLPLPKEYTADKLKIHLTFPYVR